MSDRFPVIRNGNPTDVARNGASTVRSASDTRVVWLIGSPLARLAQLDASIENYQRNVHDESRKRSFSQVLEAATRLEKKGAGVQKRQTSSLPVNGVSMINSELGIGDGPG
jgi:hypothetical protein